MAVSNEHWEERQFPTTQMFHFEWKIDGFLAKLDNLGNHVESRAFPKEGLPQWFIQIFPRGKNDDEENFSVYLMLKKAEKDQTAVADYTVWLLDDRTNVVAKTSAKKSFEEGTGYCAMSIPVGTDRPIPLSKADKLAIRVDMIVEEKVISLSLPLQISKSSLAEDLTKLFITGELADFDIESGDGRHFPVHKCILAIRVEKFRQMFNSGVVGSIPTQLKLPEVKGDIVAALLEFVYTDDVVNLSAVASELVKVAHEYQMDRLTCMCEAEMVSSLNVDTFTVALNTAKLCGLNSLLSACEKFLKSHTAVAVQMVLTSENH